MTTILRFQPADLLQCRFAVSPLGEVTDALRFLGRAARHATPEADGYHLPWQRQVRPLLADLSIGPLLAVTGIGGYQPDFLTPVPDSPFAEIGTEIGRVRAAPTDRVEAEMARTLALPGAARALADYPWLANDPARARDTLADMLQIAWTALVEPWWPRLRDVLDADITYRARRMANDGIAATIGELSKHVSLSPDGVLRFDPPGAPLELDLSGRELVLVPSVFAWPGTGMGWDPPSVIYPARGIFGLWEQGAQSPGDLARLIGKTRAELLTALDDPASTTGLAARVGVPVSSVSEHLAVLRATGLVTTTRTGRYLIHQRTALGLTLAGVLVAVEQDCAGQERRQGAILGPIGRANILTAFGECNSAKRLRSSVNNLTPLRFAKREHAFGFLRGSGGEHGDVHLDLSPIARVCDGGGCHLGREGAEDVIPRVRGPVPA
jgi:DNA-binding transcriptional ArsR family regulator